MNKKSIIFIIIGIIFCSDLYSQRINDSISIIKRTYNSIIFEQLPNRFFVIKDKHIINEFDTTSKTSNNLSSLFIIHAIKKYQKYYLIQVTDSNNNSYEIITLKRNHLFQRKIRVGEKYNLKLYPYYRKNYKKEVMDYLDVHNLDCILYKGQILHIDIIGENIYNTSNLSGVFYSRESNDFEVERFDINRFLNAMRQ
jgi:hypothetical protein